MDETASRWVIVVHPGQRAHHVEIHAFTATGRSLLSQRNQAWRRGGAR